MTKVLGETLQSCDLSVKSDDVGQRNPDGFEIRYRGFIFEHAVDGDLSHYIYGGDTRLPCGRHRPGNHPNHRCIND